MTTSLSEQALKLAIEQMLEGIQIIDSDWRYVYVNQAAALHGRKQKEELMGCTMMACYPGIEATEMFKVLENVAATNRPRSMQNEFEFEDGRVCWFELFVEPYAGGVLVRSFDITERKKLEEQLRHAQKLETVGQLAGGIAHDFNNKLAVIMACGEMIRSHSKGKDPVIDEYVDRILQAVDQSSSLARQLLAFGRKQVLDLRVVNLNPIIEATRNTLPKLLGERIDVRFDLQEDLENVRADGTQMDQVILNLAINARDAMPAGGTLTIETSNVLIDDEYARAHSDVTPGRFVMLAISDSGNGMDAETKSRIFEPFFTTKPKGEGTGLGLAMVHGIVKQSKGHVWVYSEVGMGSVFKIYLPSVSEVADCSIPSLVARVSPEGDETILVVEDDPILREAYEIALRNAGYTPVVAENPGRAADLFTDLGGKVDLLLTDVVLPEMNGRQLYERLTKKNPGLRVVFMSGYTENAIVNDGVLIGEFVLLQKPISIQHLLETLRMVLDGRMTRGVT